MALSLSEAAKYAKLSTDELKLHIQSGKLIARRASDSPSARYLIEQHDLDAFLTKNTSVTELWSDEKELDEHEEQLVLGTSTAGSLRRVLTVEAVSELRVQYRILTGRVETLERLFSEFIEAEKTLDNTLVLNDTWKIEGEKKDAPEIQQSEEPTEQNSEIIFQNEMTAQKGKDKAPSENLLKSKLAGSDEGASEELGLPKSGIDQRLKEYERRLAEAKQTANRLWH